MSIADKIMFWKKKDSIDDFNLGLDNNNLDQDFGMSGGFGGEGDMARQQMPPVQQPVQQSAFQPSFQQQPVQPPVQQPIQQNYGASKDMEIISSKIDALRASIEGINQRLANIERMAMSELERKKGW